MKPENIDERSNDLEVLNLDEPGERYLVLMGDQLVHDAVTYRYRKFKFVPSLETCSKDKLSRSLTRGQFYTRLSELSMEKRHLMTVI